MKLLQKSDIQKAKGIDRQREIEEGTKLAKRVDALREISAQEEASLAKFRRETLSTIAKETTEAAQKRDTLLYEVNMLEDRRKAALVPVLAQQEAVRDETHRLEEVKTSLDARELTIGFKEQEMEEWGNDLDKRDKRVSYTQMDASERLEKASILNNNAERLKREAADTLHKAREESDVLRAEILKREAAAKELEETLAAKEKQLYTRETELRDSLIRLQDRERTLERNLNRYKIKA